MTTTINQAGIIKSSKQNHSNRPGDPPSVWNTKVECVTPTLYFNPNVNTQTTGPASGQAAGPGAWVRGTDNYTLSTAVRALGNPPAINSWWVNASRSVWAICANRLPWFYQPNAISVGAAGSAGADDPASGFDSASVSNTWVEGCYKYNRYRVKKCKITLRPLTSAINGGMPKLLGFNVVHDSFNSFNRPIQINKVPATAAQGDATAQPTIGVAYTYHDALLSNMKSKINCWGGGWRKINDPKEDRFAPIVVEWNAPTWYYNSGRFPKEFQDIAYNTTLDVQGTVANHDEWYRPTLLVPDGRDTNSDMGRLDHQILEMTVNSPVFLEPYLLSPSEWREAGPSDTGANNLSGLLLFSCNIEYDVEFSDPKQDRDIEGKHNYTLKQLDVLYDSAVTGLNTTNRKQEWHNLATLYATKHAVVGGTDGYGTHVSADRTTNY